MVSSQGRALIPANPGAEGAQAGILHHVLGIGAAAGDPACQREGVAEMRQHEIIEARVGVAGRRVFIVGVCIADFVATAGAFVSPERVAAWKAHDRHGLPLVE
jgi:hypothetical protein